MKIRYLGMVILAITLVFAGCGKGKEEINKKSMSQLQAEEGIPVDTRTIQPEVFQYILSFDANVRGISDAVATSKVSDRVEEVLYKVGDKVEKNAVVVKFPKSNITANYYQMKSNYENASINLKRMLALVKTDGISKRDFDNARTNYELARANWNNAREMVDVPSPVSGTITRINFLKTENVEVDDVLFAVSDTSTLKCKIWVQEKDISKIAVGNQAKATWKDNTIIGKITKLDLSLNPQYQAFGADLEFDNSENLISSGVNAKISVIPYENTRAVVLKRKEIIFTGTENYVFVVQGDKAVKKVIETGTNYQNDVEVVSGLNFGDILISKGNRSVEDGSLIKVVNQE